MPKGVYKKTEDHIKKITESNKNYWSKIDRTAENNNYWNGGKSKDSKGYILIHSPEHKYKRKDNYVLEHRLVAERCLGRYLTKSERMYHINGKIDDNRPENLYLFESTSEHTKYRRNPYPLKSNL